MEAFTEHIHEHDRERIRAQIHRCLETGETYSAEYRLSSGNHKPRWVSATARVLYDTSGKPARFPGVAVDITHLKEIEEALTDATVASKQQLAELEAVYMFAPVGLCVFDPGLRWIRVNKLMADCFGRGEREFLGHSFEDLLPELAGGFEKPLKEVVETKKAVLNVEIAGESPTEEGTIRIWRSSFYPLFSAGGGLSSVNVVTEDITDERRATEEHLAHRTILEMVAKQAPLEKILEAFTEAVEKIFPGATCYIAHDDVLGERVVPLGHRMNELVQKIFYPPIDSDPEGLFAQVIMQRKEVLLPDIVEAHAGSFVDRLKVLGVRSCWVKPIVLLDG
jgi:PAS domain S-box-containing protein